MTPRTARCSCGETCPSDAARAAQAFFEDRGPESEYARETCAECGCYRHVHADQKNGAVHPCVPGGRAVRSHAFRPRGAHEFDAFFCGHSAGLGT